MLSRSAVVAVVCAATLYASIVVVESGPKGKGKANIVNNNQCGPGTKGKRGWIEHHSKEQKVPGTYIVKLENGLSKAEVHQHMRRTDNILKKEGSDPDCRVKRKGKIVSIGELKAYKVTCMDEFDLHMILDDYNVEIIEADSVFYTEGRPKGKGKGRRPKPMTTTTEPTTKTTEPTTTTAASTTATTEPTTKTTEPTTKTTEPTTKTAEPTTKTAASTTRTPISSSSKPGNSIFNSASAHLGGGDPLGMCTIKESCKPRMAASWGADSLDGFTDTRAKCDGVSCSWLSGSVNIKGTGEGVHVYIFDTGVDLRHPEFCGRIHTVYDASGGSGHDLSVDGHGTHVAGIIAGATTGVAPDATIHILQLENEYGAMTLQTILCAIEMAKNDIEENNRTRVIGSMSIQGGHNKVLNDALAEMAKMPVPLPIIVAAGNYLEGYSLTRDSCECSPASEETVITVAGSDGAYVCDTSNTGSCVDIFAPGIGINTTSRGSTYDSECEGTSYAAPFVTGALAAHISTLPDNELPLTIDDLKLKLDTWWGKDRPSLYSPLSTFQGAPNKVLVYNQCP